MFTSHCLRNGSKYIWFRDRKVNLKKNFKKLIFLKFLYLLCSNKAFKAPQNFLHLNCVLFTLKVYWKKIRLFLPLKLIFFQFFFIILILNWMIFMFWKRNQTGWKGAIQGHFRITTVPNHRAISKGSGLLIMIMFLHSNGWVLFMFLWAKIYPIGLAVKYKKRLWVIVWFWRFLF